jgi:hypothetical protein
MVDSVAEGLVVEGVLAAASVVVAVVLGAVVPQGVGESS